MLDHLAPGLTWVTAMYARDELGGMGHGRAPGYGCATPHRSVEMFSPRVRALFVFGQEFGAPWPMYPALLGLNEVDIPELIEIVSTWDLSATNAGFSAEQCGPRHAWRALGQLRASAAVGALLEAMLYQRNEEAFEYTSELPTALIQIGPAAIPEVKCFLERSDVDWPYKLVALEALVGLTKLHPEVRARVEEIARAMLERSRTCDASFHDSSLQKMERLNG